MLARWQSCIEQSMVEKLTEAISENTLDHAYILSISHHVLLILMFGRGQLSRVMEPCFMTMSCYMWMMNWLSVKMQSLSYEMIQGGTLRKRRNPLDPKITTEKAKSGRSSLKMV